MADVQVNEPLAEPGGADNGTRSDANPRQPAQPPSGTPERRCFVCLADESEDLVKTEWVTPCPCTLEGHQECMLAWVENCETERKPLVCPVCKAPIQFEGPRNPALSLHRAARRAFWAATPWVLTGATLGGMATNLLVHGLANLYVFAGREATAAVVFRQFPPAGVADINWGRCLVVANSSTALLAFGMVPGIGTNAMPALGSILLGIEGLINPAFSLPQWPPHPWTALFAVMCARTAYWRIYDNYIGTWERSIDRQLAALLEAQPRPHGDDGLRRRRDNDNDNNVINHNIDNINHNVNHNINNNMNRNIHQNVNHNGNVNHMVNGNHNVNGNVNRRRRRDHDLHLHGHNHGRGRVDGQLQFDFHNDNGILAWIFGLVDFLDGNGRMDNQLEHVVGIAIPPRPPRRRALVEQRRRLAARQEMQRQMRQQVPAEERRRLRLEHRIMRRRDQENAMQNQPGADRVAAAVARYREINGLMVRVDGMNAELDGRVVEIEDRPLEAQARLPEVAGADRAAENAAAGGREPAVEPVVQPAAEPLVAPATEPAAQPLGGPAAGPFAEPAAEPAAQPLGGPAVEQPAGWIFGPAQGAGGAQDPPANLDHHRQLVNAIGLVEAIVQAGDGARLPGEQVMPHIEIRIHRPGDENAAPVLLHLNAPRALGPPLVIPQQEMVLQNLPHRLFNNLLENGHIMIPEVLPRANLNARVNPNVRANPNPMPIGNPNPMPNANAVMRAENGMALYAILLGFARDTAASLVFPTVCWGAGAFLRLALLPRSWTAPPSPPAAGGGGRPTGLMQYRWGRSLVGGCMFIVLRDALRLYAKYRKLASQGQRRVRSVPRRRGQADGPEAASDRPS